MIEAPGDSAHYGDFAEPPDQEGRQVVELVAAGIHPIVRGLASGQHYGSSVQLISDGAIDVPVRTFPLSMASKAWEAAKRGRPRVVILAG